MAKARNQFEALAAKGAERIERARAVQQLDLWSPPEPDAGALVADGPRQPGQRGKGKAVSQFREWLALKGYRMPEDALAEMAGLTANEDVFMAAMTKTEQLLLWAYGHSEVQPKVRLELFMQIYAAMLRAADALLPYGLAKVQGDAAPVAPVQVNIIGRQASQGRAAPRDVTPKAGRIAPPPMPHEMQENQGLGEDEDAGSDSESRTE